MIEAVCCPKTAQPLLQIDKNKMCPKLMPFRYTHRSDGSGNPTCSCCGILKKLAILDVLRKTRAGKYLLVLTVLGDGPRVDKKSGVQNTQRELLPQEMTVANLIANFEQALGRWIPHYQAICWLKITQENHLAWLHADSILVDTDFSAVIDLCTRSALTCSHNDHCICDNFIVLSNRETLPVKKKKETGEESSGYNRHSCNNQKRMIALSL